MFLLVVLVCFVLVLDCKKIYSEICMSGTECCSISVLCRDGLSVLLEPLKGCLIDNVMNLISAFWIWFSCCCFFASIEIKFEKNMNINKCSEKRLALKWDKIHVGLSDERFDGLWRMDKVMHRGSFTPIKSVDQMYLWNPNKIHKFFSLVPFILCS